MRKAQSVGKVSVLLVCGPCLIECHVSHTNYVIKTPENLNVICQCLMQFLPLYPCASVTELLHEDELSERRASVLCACLKNSIWNRFCHIYLCQPVMSGLVVILCFSAIKIQLKRGKECYGWCPFAFVWSVRSNISSVEKCLIFKGEGVIAQRWYSDIVCIFV